MKARVNFFGRAGRITSAIAALTVSSLLIASFQVAASEDSREGALRKINELDKVTQNAEASAIARTAMAAYAGYLENEAEESLEVESWMVDQNAFFMDVYLEEAVEEPLEIENWMVEEPVFGTIPYPEEITEEPLRLEKWMLDNKLFSVPGSEHDASEEEVME